MRKVFSSNEVTETALVRDALVHRGFEATIQNQHSGHSAVPAFRPPAEVWIAHDQDYENARRVVVDAIAVMHSKAAGKPWVCAGCREENPQSFEVCWSCGREKGGAAGDAG